MLCMTFFASWLSRRFGYSLTQADNVKNPLRELDHSVLIQDKDQTLPNVIHNELLNWGNNINDSTTVVEGSVLLVQWLIQHEQIVERQKGNIREVITFLESRENSEWCYHPYR